MYYGLVLSHMRDENFETSFRLAAWARTKEALLAFVAAETEPGGPWVDENPSMANLNGTYRYHKVFRKGSPLEWFNAPDERSYVEVATPDEVAEIARQQRAAQLLSTFHVR